MSVASCDQQLGTGFGCMPEQRSGHRVVTSRSIDNVHGEAVAGKVRRDVYAGIRTMVHIANDWVDGYHVD